MSNSVFFFKFVMCKSKDNFVESVDANVQCTVTEDHVFQLTNFCITKINAFINKVIGDGFVRVSSCQESNLGNFSYLQILRRHCLAGQIRQGIFSGISRGATRPAQPIHLGVFDPLHDSQIFGLASKNNFQVTFLGKEIENLDSLLGKLWDVKLLEPGNPFCHFTYVCKIKFFVNRQSMCLRCSFYYSESDEPFTPEYRNRCKY